MADFYYSARDILDKAMGTDSYFQIKSILFGLKAADVAPVRHGRWKNGGNGLYDTCTACGEEIYLAIPMNYCPLCGARIDKEADHD